MPKACRVGAARHETRHVAARRDQLVAADRLFDANCKGGGHPPIVPLLAVESRRVGDLRSWRKFDVDASRRSPRARTRSWRRLPGTPARWPRPPSRACARDHSRRSRRRAGRRRCRTARSAGRRARRWPARPSRRPSRARPGRPRRGSASSRRRAAPPYRPSRGHRSANAAHRAARGDRCSRTTRARGSRSRRPSRRPRSP